MNKTQRPFAAYVAWTALLLVAPCFAQTSTFNLAEQASWWMEPPENWGAVDPQGGFIELNGQHDFRPHDFHPLTCPYLIICKDYSFGMFVVRSGDNDLRFSSATSVSIPSYDEIVVTAVGDVMLGTTFPDVSGADLPPNDGADLLQEVTPLLKRGDVVLGNLEGPMVDSGVSGKCRGKALGHCFAFRVPTRYGAHLKTAGFNVMGLANNHAMDFGAEGRESSRHVLDEQGIAHTGELGDVAHLTAKGKKIDVIAFATYPSAYNFLDLDDALETIRRARAEADLVIVSFHGGAEGASHQHVAPGDETFLGEDRGDLRKFAHAAIDAGAQLVIGSGPHVVRAMEIYQGKLIAYSLGNFATYGPFNLNGENGLSLILEVHLAPDGSFFRGQIHPVKQEKPGGPKLDPKLSIVPILRSLSHKDFQQSGVVVGPRGELWLPGTEVPECSNTPDLLEQPLYSRLCSIFP